MAHYAWLVGCSSRESAARYDLAAIEGTGEPRLEARYSIPLLWLACYGPGDAITVRDRGAQAAADAQEFIVLCAPVADVTARLRRRQDSLLRLTGPSFAPLCADWIGFLERSYARQILLRTEDLFSMDGYERSGLRLQAALRFLAVADSGQRIRERAAIEWFSAIEGAFDHRAPDEDGAAAAIRWRVHLSGISQAGDSAAIWPVRASAEEIAFACARSEQPTPGVAGAATAGEAALTHAVREGVFPESIGSSLQLAVRKAAGDLPLGVSAPTKGLRKAIAGGGELLAVVGQGIAGLILALLGAGFLWAGVVAGHDWKTAGVGAGLLAASVWLLRSAYRAVRNVRAILRA